MLPARAIAHLTKSHVPSMKTSFKISARGYKIPKQNRLLSLSFVAFRNLKGKTLLLKASHILDIGLEGINLELTLKPLP